MNIFRSEIMDYQEIVRFTRGNYERIMFSDLFRCSFLDKTV